MKVAKATSQPQETAMHLFFENEDVGENYAYTTSEWDLHKMVLTILWFGLLQNIAWTTKVEKYLKINLFCKCSIQHIYKEEKFG